MTRVSLKFIFTLYHFPAPLRRRQPPSIVFREIDIHPIVLAMDFKYGFIGQMGTRLQFAHIQLEIFNQVQITDGFHAVDYSKNCLSKTVASLQKLLRLCKNLYIPPFRCKNSYIFDAQWRSHALTLGFDIKPRHHCPQLIDHRIAQNVRSIQIVHDFLDYGRKNHAHLKERIIF